MSMQLLAYSQPLLRVRMTAVPRSMVCARFIHATPARPKMYRGAPPGLEQLSYGSRVAAKKVAALGSTPADGETGQEVTFQHIDTNNDGEATGRETNPVHGTALSGNNISVTFISQEECRQRNWERSVRRWATMTVTDPVHTVLPRCLPHITSQTPFGRLLTISCSGVCLYRGRR